MAAHRRFLVPWFALVLSLPTVVTSRLNAQISVTPDGGSAIVALNSTEKSVSFTLYTGRSTTETWHVTPECLGVVTGCWSPNGYDFTFMQATGVTIKFSTPSPGSGTVRLRAERLGVTDEGWYNVTVDGTPPEVRLLAPVGDVGVEYPTIQLAWCDNTSLNAATRSISVNVVNKNSSFDYVSNSGPADCIVKATSTTNTVALNVGSNQISAWICDNVNNCANVQNFYVTRVTYGVVVTPDGATAPQRPANSSGHSEIFTVQNTGTGQNTYNLSCGGSPNVTCTGLTINGTPVTSVTLAGGNSSPVTASYDVGVVGSGSLTLTASGTNANDNGSFTVPVVTPSALPSVVDINSVNPGTFVERGLCLTIAAGAAAASECGDLRIIHALPTTRTMNKARTPTLLYNSQTAHPYPIVAANVTLPATAAVPDSVTATVWMGPPQARRKYLSGQWVPGQTRRVAVGFDALSFATGIHAYTFEIINWYPAPTDSQVTRVNGELVIVNRSNSPFGAGWWLAGLEQLFWIPDGRRLVVLGDGSARVYSPVGGSLYTAPNPTRPDTLDGQGTDYIRRAPHGVRVHFSAATGKHISTINRLGHQTQFAYESTSCARLSTISVPPSGSGPVYTFNYVSPTDCATRLSSVTAPGNRTTALTNPAGKVTAISDPDTRGVGFSYDPGFANRIRSRTDRRGTTTFYAFDAGSKLTMDSLPLGTGQTPIVQRIRPAESVGLTTAVDTALVYTSLNGPRIDVNDTTALWLDRFGAPRRIVNALGHQTTITRGDARWPALATELTAPNGFVTRAAYDGRGNIVRGTAVNPLGTGQDATTRYHWDLKWDFVDSIVTPTGRVTTMAYDAVNGNRLWEQVGTDAARRVAFRYGNAWGLLSSTVVPQTPPDSILYDDQLGNLLRTRTARGFETDYRTDEIGRVTQIDTRIDTLVNSPPSCGCWEYQTTETHFDDLDRDTMQVTIGPLRFEQNLFIPEEKVVVRKFYNDNGQLDSLSRRAIPDTNGIGTITTRWHHDRAGRQVAEIAPDGRKDSTVFDPAGNAVRLVTRRDSVMRMEYDELNRLLKRVVPMMPYAARDEGVPTRAIDQPEDTPYPLYSNDGTGGYRIDSDSAVFTYDSLNNIRTADNSDAKVARSYYPNGLLRSETQRLRTVDGADFDTHVYQLQFEYDLDGRRTLAVHPAQLKPPPPWKNTVLYDYDRQTGELSWMQGLTWEDIFFHYNLRGELDTLRYGHAGISEAYVYDADGRMREHRVRNQSISPHRFADSLLRNSRFEHDARGKVLAEYNTRGSRDTLLAQYSGLGHVVHSQLSSRGESQGNQLRWYTDEWFINDAFANIDSTSQYWIRTANGTPLGSGSSSDNSVYTPGTGRLFTSRNQRRSYFYDAAGNTQFMTQIPVSNVAEDRASYFAADGVLRAADWRQMIWSGNTPIYRMAFEEYRYDALGRRVLVRSRRSCKNGNEGECQLSFVRRTVWDGDDELYEIQMPDTPQWRENDTAAVAPLPSLLTEFSPDPNPFYGRVAYVHGLGIDRPLVVVRINRAELHHQNGYYLWRTLIINPHWNSRGLVDLGTFRDGGASYCEQDTQGRDRCLLNTWPDGWFAYARQTAWKPGAWVGTLLEDKRDKTGTLYRRHRHYDPATGRFTQEDPIGLAGGLNLYGFADGDPVNFSDPFGLQSGPCHRPFLGTTAEQFSACMASRTGALPGIVEAWWNAILAVTPMGAGSGTLTRLGLAKAGTELVAAGRALSRAAAAKGRETLVQQGARVLTTSRHAPTGSRASAAAHDFAAAGLDFADVAAAVTRDIGDLSQLAPGIGRGVVEVGGQSIRYRTWTLESGETIVNFWMAR